MTIRNTPFDNLRRVQGTIFEVIFPNAACYVNKYTYTVHCKIKKCIGVEVGVELILSMPPSNLLMGHP